MSSGARPGKRAKLTTRHPSCTGLDLSPIAEATAAAAAGSAAKEASPAAPASDPEWFNPRDPDKVRAVKAVMHVAAASAQLQQQPECRAQQVKELEAMVEAAVRDRVGCAIYVSGCPGSGKSLTVHSTARRLQQQVQEAALQVVSINCMSLSQPGDVFARVSGQLPAAADTASGAADTPRDRLKLQLQRLTAFSSPQKAALKRRGRPRKPAAASAQPQPHDGMVIVILDELDRLLAHDQSILNDVFCLPQAPGSHLILIGIANSIDLTERSLPQLQALGCKPALVTFPSYSADELTKLLAQRQAQLPGPAFQETALRLCARMVSTRSGDMRRALEVCAAAIDQLVADSATDSQQLPAELQVMSQQTMSQQGVSHRQVRLAQMSKALQKCQGGSGQFSAVVATVKGLPQQQQLVLCALVLLLRKRGEAAEEAAGGFPATPVKTPLRLAQIASPKASPITPGKRKAPSGGTSKPYASSPYHTPKKPKLPSARSGKGLMSPGGKGTPASGRALGSGKTLAGDAVITLGTLHDSYAAMMHKVSMKALSSCEFAAACSTLADLGVVTLSRGATEERLRRITLQANTGDAALALQECRLAKDCLALTA